MERTTKEKITKEYFVQKIKNFKSWFEEFSKSNAFIYAVIGVVFLFHALALDLFGIATMAILAILSYLFVKNCRAGLTFTLSAIFVVSSKNSPGYSAGENYYATPQILIPIICLIVLLVVSMLIRCIKNRKNYKNAKLYIPMAILFIALSLSGVGREYYEESILFGVIMGLSYFAIYLLFVGCIDSFDGLFDYVATLLSALCLLIAVQVFFFYAMSLLKNAKFDSSWKDRIVIGWGVSNIVGEMMVFFMPFVMYKVQKSKHYNFYNIVSLMAMAALVLTLNRAGMLFGFIVFGFLWIRNFIKSKNRRVLALSAIIFVSLGIIALMVATAVTNLGGVFEYFETVFIKNDRISLSSRDKLWKQAIKFFKESPWVGEGFARSFNEQIYGTPRSTMFHTLSHNFIFQILGSGGVMGLVSAGIFIFAMIKTYTKKYEGKIFAISYGILYLGISLLDTTYFITYAVMFMIFITATVEKLSKKEEEKDVQKTAKKEAKAENKG